MLGKLVVLVVEFVEVDVVLLFVLLVHFRLGVFFDFGQDHFGIIEDAVQRGHLLVRVVGLDGVLVQMVR